MIKFLYDVDDKAEFSAEGRWKELVDGSSFFISQVYQCIKASGENRLAKFYLLVMRQLLADENSSLMKAIAEEESHD